MLPIGSDRLGVDQRGHRSSMSDRACPGSERSGSSRMNWPVLAQRHKPLSHRTHEALHHASPLGERSDIPQRRWCR